MGWATFLSSVLSLLLLLVGLAIAVFWMVVAWRAMRAHETLAESHKRLVEATNLLARYYRYNVEGEVPREKNPEEGIEEPRA